jgi:hypothetical protein
MTSKLSDEIRAFLKHSFPQASIDDGYYFVSFRAKAWRLVKEECIQDVADRMCEGKCWLIAVNVDPRSYVHGQVVEERPVTYNPDWNIEQEHTQYILEFNGKIGVASVLRAERSPGALAIINPSQGIAFDVNMRRIYAESESALERFIEGIEESLEPPEPEYSLT